MEAIDPPTRAASIPLHGDSQSILLPRLDYGRSKGCLAWRSLKGAPNFLSIWCTANFAALLRLEQQLKMDSIGLRSQEEKVAKMILKPTRCFIYALALVTFGCSTPQRQPPPIPANQIPPGFEAKDCYWKIVPPPQSHKDDVTPINRLPAMRAAPESDPEPQRFVHCHRSEEHPRKCIGSDGQEKPMSACETQKP